MHQQSRESLLTSTPLEVKAHANHLLLSYNIWNQLNSFRREKFNSSIKVKSVFCNEIQQAETLTFGDVYTS